MPCSTSRTTAPFSMSTAPDWLSEKATCVHWPTGTSQSTSEECVDAPPSGPSGPLRSSRYLLSAVGTRFPVFSWLPPRTRGCIERACSFPKMEMNSSPVSAIPSSKTPARDMMTRRRVRSAGAGSAGAASPGRGATTASVSEPRLSHASALIPPRKWIESLPGTATCVEPCKPPQDPKPSA